MRRSIDTQVTGKDGNGVEKQLILNAAKASDADIKPGFFYTGKYSRKVLAAEMDTPFQLETYDAAQALPISTLTLSVAPADPKAAFQADAAAVSQQFLEKCQDLAR